MVRLLWMLTTSLCFSLVDFDTSLCISLMNCENFRCWRVLQVANQPHYALSWRGRLYKFIKQWSFRFVLCFTNENGQRALVLETAQWVVIYSTVEVLLISKGLIRAEFVWYRFCHSFNSRHTTSTEWFIHGKYGSVNWCFPFVLSLISLINYMRKWVPLLLTHVHAVLNELKHFNWIWGSSDCIDVNEWAQPDETWQIVLDGEHVLFQSSASSRSSGHEGVIKVDYFVGICGVHRMPEWARYELSWVRQHPLKEQFCEGLRVRHQTTPPKSALDIICCCLFCAVPCGCCMCPEKNAHL